MTDPAGSRAPEEAARPATATDLPAIAALATELRSILAPERGGALWIAHDALPTPSEPTLAARLGDPALTTLVGTLDDVVLGYALAHLEQLTDGRALAVLDELLIAEPARSVGLGEVLLGALTTWATAAGALGLDASALPGDRRAKNFFESAGFKSRRLVMHKTLQASDDA
jgi:GNAT superfamily N-acetyltransferase